MKFDHSRIEQHPFLSGYEFHEESGSTSDIALGQAVDPNLQCPHLVLSAHQTSGRGRGSNVWWAQPGALTFSLVLDAAQLPLAASQWPLISLATGLAVLKALKPLALDRTWHVKWPNDVYLEQKKVCGILAESSRGATARLVIGIGINVNNSLSGAPVEIRETATSLTDEAQGTFPLTDVLLRTLTSLDDVFSSLKQDYRYMSLAWPEVCYLTAHEVEIQVGERIIRGRCRGISPDGALLVETNNGLETCHAGVTRRRS